MYDVHIDRDVRIPTGRAGISLSADVVRPDTAKPVPVLVTVLPYRNDAGGGLMMASELEWFASHGYASMLVDPRGIGSSDGRQRPPFDAAEADDGVAAVTWAAEQPWCTGAVGMWGHSYGGLLALRTAERRPPALRAILPAMALSDPERDFVHPAGLRGGLGPLTWGVVTLLNQLLPPLHDRDDPHEQRRWAQRLDSEPWLIDLLRHPPGDPAWRQRPVDLAAITAPTLCIAGWHDLFCAATIRAYEQINAPKKLIVGPWMHTMPHVAPDAAIDFRNIALRWWDHWLRDHDTGLLNEPDATIHLQGASGGWTEFPTWPPTHDVADYHATSDRALGTAAADPGVELAIPVDPAVGTRSGLIGLPSGFGLPLDQHDDDMRCLHLTSEPLSESVTVVGAATVTVAHHGATVDRLVVRFSHVDPDGRSSLISTGAAALPEAPGAVTVALTPTGYRIPAGDRIRLAVGIADVPRLWPTDTRDEDMRIGGVSLALPIATTAGESVDVDIPDPSLPILIQKLRRGGGSWTTSTDHLSQLTEITTAEHGETTTLTGEHILEITSRRALRIPHGAATGADARCTGTFNAALTGGRQVQGTVGLVVDDESASLIVEVIADGTSLLKQAWTI